MYCISVHQVTILGWNPHVKPILQMPQTHLSMPFSVKNNMSMNKFHAGAIVGDGDRKPWARAHLWLWENFAILRTDCSTLTTYSRAVVRGSYCVLAWTFSCCVINSESCKVLLRIFHSDGWEWETQPRSQRLSSSRPSVLYVGRIAGQWNELIRAKRFDARERGQLIWEDSTYFQSAA